MLAKGSNLDASSRRAWLIPLILAAESSAAVQIPHPWFNIYLLRGVPVFFALTLLFFGRAELKGLGDVTFQRKWAVRHALTLVLIVVAELYLLAFQQQSASPAYTVIGDAWALLLVSLVPSLLLTFFPLERLLATARRLGRAWLFAAVCSGALVAVMEGLRRSWGTPGNGFGLLLQNTAFNGTKRLLTLFYPHVLSNPQTNLLGTERFQVLIGGTCSGVQGLALLSVLLLTWSLYDRKRLRLERVLLVGTMALATMWLLNMVRLAVLIAIGDAGHPQIAMKGFHSEAGWIALNCVTLCLLLVVERVAWFHRTEPARIVPQTLVATGSGARSTRNVPAIYLLPFLAITAAAIVSRAASGGFEWLYPLRFIAAAAVLWAYRAEYRKMDLRFGSAGVLAGLAVAAMWIGVYRMQVAPGGSQLSTDELTAYVGGLTHWSRVTWITFRVLAAVITVPLAEELAFRGFLARRIVGANPDLVPYAKLSTVAILISAVCFGLMHGVMWGPGIASGVVFGLLAKYKNRLGDAVAAHAIANLGIAAWVLLRNDFGLW